MTVEEKRLSDHRPADNAELTIVSIEDIEHQFNTMNKV